MRPRIRVYWAFYCLIDVEAVNDSDERSSEPGRCGRRGILVEEIRRSEAVSVRLLACLSAKVAYGGSVDNDNESSS